MLNVGEDEEKVQRQAMEERRKQARLAKVSQYICGTVHTCCEILAPYTCTYNIYTNSTIAMYMHIFKLLVSSARGRQ